MFCSVGEILPPFFSSISNRIHLLKTWTGVHVVKGNPLKGDTMQPLFMMWMVINLCNLKASQQEANESNHSICEDDEILKIENDSENANIIKNECKEENESPNNNIELVVFLLKVLLFSLILLLILELSQFIVCTLDKMK